MENEVDTLDATQSRRFCATVIALVVVAFAGVAICNFAVDPYAQYGTGWLKPLVQTSRDRKTELLTAQSQQVEGLVLGSSRVLKVEPEYLEACTGQRFLNAGVNFGKPEDYLALARFYKKQRGALPKTIILGLDVNSLTDSQASDARLVTNTNLGPLVPEAVSWRDRSRRWNELLSWQQTKLSLKSAKLQLAGGGLPEPEQSFQDDGLIVYHRRQREMDEGVYDFQDALEYTKGEYKHFFTIGKLSEERCELLQALIELCESEKTELYVYLTPLHPELSSHLHELTEYAQRRLEVQRVMEYLTERHQFHFVDLTEIASFDGDPKRFVDGIHPLEENTRRIVDRVLASAEPQREGDKVAIQ